jgi:PIN domain nuclease of toxin-antitoxin system
MLIYQVQLEQLTIVTRDKRFSDYDVMVTPA